MESKLYKRVYGIFNPKRIDDLEPNINALIGSGLHWEYIWLIDDGPYKGQYAMSPITSFNLGFAWVPECDVDILYSEDERGWKKMEVKDSGSRRDFESGAARDSREGKGRCDLLPASALLRLARLYEAGAKKYGDRNWENGMPISDMIDSGMRHLLMYLDGATDEDHLCAAAWNILGAMWMEEKHPELQDLPGRVYGKADKAWEEKVMFGIYPYCAVDKKDCSIDCPRYHPCHGNLEPKAWKKMFYSSEEEKECMEDLKPGELTAILKDEMEKVWEEAQGWKEMEKELEETPKADALQNCCSEEACDPTCTDYSECHEQIEDSNFKKEKRNDSLDALVRAVKSNGITFKKASDYFKKAGLNGDGITDDATTLNKLIEAEEKRDDSLDALAYSIKRLSGGNASDYFKKGGLGK